MRPSFGWASVVLGWILSTPMRAPIPCIEDRCPLYAEPGSSRCKKHQAERRSDPRYTGQRGTDPTWARERKVALRRADFRCERCGKNAAALRDSKRRLEVHHKDRNAKNHDQANLRVLCGPGRGSCHYIEDRAGRK